MSWLKRIFGKKEPIKNNADFWNWFKQHERIFYQAVKHHGNIERDFFEKLSPKLEELKDGFFYLAGMIDDETAELVITADGAVKNIVFVEELVRDAPHLPRWKFTALKPPLDIEHVQIKMDGHTFDSSSLSFYSNDHAAYPDEIDITIVHRHFNEADKGIITNGTYIFLDNYIGELDAITNIDNIVVIGQSDAKKELIPMAKLKDFLIWRQKEFIEKYEGVMQHTEDANFSILEAELESGNNLIATINTAILNWENKASHPWIFKMEIQYDGTASNGMPDNETYQLLDEIESRILEDLKDYEGYLNIGRQTADSMREIFFACKDFRKPSKIGHQVKVHYLGHNIHIEYDLYKDKYWQSFNRFMSN